MKSLIVVESCFGSTRALAEQVAAGFREGGAEAEIVSVTDAAGEVPAETDLLMLGAPTHKLGLSTPKSRQIAKTQGGVAGDRGMREWLAKAVLPADVRVVVFDTVTGHTWMSGSAAKKIAKILASRNSSAEVIRRSFLVSGEPPAPVPEELDEARAWGAELARG